MKKLENNCKGLYFPYLPYPASVIICIFLGDFKIELPNQYATIYNFIQEAELFHPLGPSMIAKRVLEPGTALSMCLSIPYKLAFPKCAKRFF